MHNLRLLSFILSFLIFDLSSTAQIFGNLSYGTDSTLEVVTWNIENFPKEDQATMDYVAEIITGLDADMIALQEIYDPELFNQMLENMDEFSGYIVSGGYTDLAYIYKTETVVINQIYEIYTSSSYSGPFPRSPLVIDFNYKNQNFIVINNHLKCCGDGIMDTGDPDDEETRRYLANNLLRQYITDNFADKNVYIVGDMNDEITDNESDNVFQVIINDSQNYLFADTEIANGNSSGWSYPSWPSHLDHIAITSELFAAFENEGSEISVLRMDEHFVGGWNEYDDNVSDHRPVAIKLSIPDNLGIETPDASKHTLVCFPNPFIDATTFSFPPFTGIAELRINNIYGQLIYSGFIDGSKSSVIWNSGDIPAGIYFAGMIINGAASVTTILVVNR